MYGPGDATPPPLTVSCFSKIQIGFTFLVPAHLGSPRQRAVKRVCVCVLSFTYSESLQWVKIPINCSFPGLQNFEPSHSICLLLLNFQVCVEFDKMTSD